MIENIELLADTTLSDEKGLIVESVSTDGKKRIRIRFKGNDSYLDPCNLPEGIAIGQSIRFSGTLYRINGTDHMNLDLFPFSFSKLEMID